MDKTDKENLYIFTATKKKENILRVMMKTNDEGLEV
jgi:hypothetical protein